MIEIKHFREQEDLKDWLTSWSNENGLDGDTTRAISVTIAHRAAMRILPEWWSWGLTKDARKLNLTALPILRCNLISGVACKMPTPEIMTPTTTAAAATTAAATAITNYASRKTIYRTRIAATIATTTATTATHSTTTATIAATARRPRCHCPRRRQRLLRITPIRLRKNLQWGRRVCYAALAQQGKPV